MSRSHTAAAAEGTSGTLPLCERSHLSPAGTARPRAGAACSRPQAPGYGFGLAASPGPSTRWLRFLLGLYFYWGDNSRDPEIAGDA